MHTNPISFYESRIENIRIQLPHIQQAKRDLTIPEIFNKTYNENFISTYLVFILNPKHNGVGQHPIESIISYFMPDFDISDLNWNELEIYREDHFTDNSRIDITINFKNKLIIGIENKISSKEHSLQTTKYYKNLSNKYNNCKLLCILLSPNGNTPNSQNFSILTYQQLYDLFKVIHIDFINNLKQSVIFQDFLTYIKEVIMKTTNDFQISKKAELYIKNIELFKELRDSFDEESQNIFNLTELISKNTFGEMYSYNWRKNYQQIYKNHWMQKNLFIHYEFSMTIETMFDSKKIEFMVDIEGKDKHLFFDNFEKKYSIYEKDFLEHSIIYRPKFRKVALAHKEYNVFDDIHFNSQFHIKKYLEKVIKNIHDDFIFLSQIIDDYVKM